MFDFLYMQSQQYFTLLLLFTGKKREGVQLGLGESVVMQLTEKIQNLQCQVFVDNFFNSPSLQYQLQQRGVLCAGTVRPNRKYLPKSSQIDIPNDKDMSRGDMFVAEANELYFVKWMDNKPVYMLSNFLSGYPQHSVSKRQKGTSERTVVQKPNVVKEYNCHMGGVDLMDQKKTTYEFDHRSRHKYYLRVVQDLIYIAVNNAHVVYSFLECTNATAVVDAKTFRRAVARDLIGEFSSRKRPTPAAAVITSKRLNISPLNNERRHTISKTEKRTRCKFCYGSKPKLNSLVNTKCVECNVHLCFNNKRTCFNLYHGIATT